MNGSLRRDPEGEVDQGEDGFDSEKPLPGGGSGGDARRRPHHLLTGPRLLVQYSAFTAPASGYFVIPSSREAAILRPFLAASLAGLVSGDGSLTRKVRLELTGWAHRESHKEHPPICCRPCVHYLNLPASSRPSIPSGRQCGPRTSVACGGAPPSSPTRAEVAGPMKVIPRSGLDTCAGCTRRGLDLTCTNRVHRMAPTSGQATDGQQSDGRPTEEHPADRSAHQRSPVSEWRWRVGSVVEVVGSPCRPHMVEYQVERVGMIGLKWRTFEPSEASGHR